MIDPRQPDYENTPASQRRATYGYTPQDIAAKPHVSIVTPFYNTGEVFAETARSVLCQSFQQWEWLIVNDGSTDPSSLRLLDSFRGRDLRIQVIDHEENKGAPVARNAGFQLASAPYLVNLDSDDLLEPTAIEKWLWFLEAHPECGFVKGHSVSFGEQRYLSKRGFEEGAVFLRDNMVTTMAMIRREVIENTGGFDPDLRTGLEDWDFWLRAANAGYWGGMVPEFLDWYRRRTSHSDRWSSWNPKGLKRFRRLARLRYPRLWERNGFPIRQVSEAPHFSRPNPVPPCQNRLLKHKPRTLFIVPWMEIGGADRVNLDWINGLIAHGHEVTVCATLQAAHRWAPKFSELTPDVFILPNFLSLTDIPRFLVYLIHSRQIDTVFIANSTLGYQLLPFLRCHCPDTTYIDINHAEEIHWLNGGHPRFGVGYQEMLDLNITSTSHLRDWMVGSAADPERIMVCHTGAASELLNLPNNRREKYREKLKLEGGLPYIVFAGRLCDQKRPLLAVEILYRLKKRGVKFYCLFIGDGELRPAVERDIRRYRLDDSVILAGAIDHEACLNYFAASDILLLPSAYEGISVALYEAMATGLVPVVSRVGGHEEVLSTKEGFLIHHGDNEIDDFVEALSRLTTEPDLLRTMGLAARCRIAENFTVDHGIEQLLSAIAHARQLSQASPRQIPTPGFALETATLAIEYARLTTATSDNPLLHRLLAKVRRYKLGRFIINNWLSKKWVKMFGQTVFRRVRSWRD